MFKKALATTWNSLTSKAPQYGMKNKKLFMGLSDAQIDELKDLKEFELLQHINSRFDAAGDVLGIPKDRLKYYRTCDELIRFQLPLIRENGEIEQVKAYRVIHKTHKQPAKGGLRINRYNNSEDLEALALMNALRAAIFDIPLGGSKGLIKINPYKYTEKEIQALVRRYTIELAKKNFIGPSIDLIGPALGTDEREMNWIKDTFQNFFGQDDVHAIACCTGKSVSNFGIEGARESQAYGLVFCMKYLLENEEFCKKNKIEAGLKGKTFTVQSFGIMGYLVSKFLIEQGAKLVGVYEYEGSLYNANGICPEELRKHMDEHHNKVSNFASAEFLEVDNVIEKPVDIYIPCYTENQIHKENQHRFNCKIVAEGTNHPITPIAGQMLRERGIYVFPDLLVNAGGVITAYFEWIKNLSHTSHGLLTKRWEQKSKMLLLNVIKNITGLNVDKLDEQQLHALAGASEYDMVISGLEEYLANAIDDCVAVSEEHKIPLRQATYVVGIQKLHQHYENVGIPFSK